MEKCDSRADGLNFFIFVRFFNVFCTFFEKPGFLCFQYQYFVLIQGRDYAGREILLTFLEEWTWDGNEWQLV